MSAGSIGQQIINGTYGGHEAAPKTAFEELLEWCTKHMSVGEYEVVEESRSYQQTIYFDLGSDELPLYMLQFKR